VTRVQEVTLVAYTVRCC